MSDEPNVREYSSKVLDGPDRAPSRAMLYPVGFDKEDFKKAKVGVASTWSEVTPCNFHIDGLAKESAEGINAAGRQSFPTRSHFRWDLDGHRGHEVFPSQPRGDRRFD